MLPILRQSDQGPGINMVKAEVVGDAFKLTNHGFCWTTSVKIRWYYPQKQRCMMGYLLSIRRSSTGRI